VVGKLTDKDDPNFGYDAQSGGFGPTASVIVSCERLNRLRVTERGGSPDSPLENPEFRSPSCSPA
jgi:hypothetical protein